MDHERALEIIRDHFSHVAIVNIFVEDDPLAGEEVAKVVVADDDLEQAFRNDGEHIRSAAIKSGLSIEVLMESEL